MQDRQNSFLKETSFLSYLLVLVAVALLPAIAFEARSELALRHASQIEIENQTLNSARLAAAEQRQIVQGIHQGLIALSDLPSIKAKDAEGCRSYLARIMKRYPGFVSFNVVDIDGTSICDASDDNKPTTAAGSPYFATVLKTGEFTVGEFAFGRKTGRNVLHFALPFYDDEDRLGGVVTAALSLNWLADTPGQPNVPPGAGIQSETRRSIFLMVLSTVLVLVVTLLGVRRYIHRPLGELVEGANQWRLGKFAGRVDVRGPPEITRIADAFNTMADSLERRDHELSLAKEKAEEAAARITMIFESTTDSVLIVDRNWRVSYHNGPAGAQLAEGRDIVGMFLSEAFPVAAGMEALEQIQNATSERRPAFLETLCPRTKIWYAINAFPSSQGLAIFIRDISDHKHALEARRLIEEQLFQSQKMESVGQLTGGIAHDFNNLLTVISANLELIEDDADIGRVRRYAAVARRATSRGAKLTAQLLAFSRRQALKPELIDANQLLSEFMELVQQAVGEVCEVKLQFEDRLWPCHVDPTLLETAILNLALNARDAMADGGVLKIETRNVVEDGSLVPECPPGSYVRLSVADTGCGMTPEVRDRVFEPFFTTKDVGKGTGLGLSMVHGFVRQSGGQITVRSALGAGTTVDLYLPMAGQAREAEPEYLQSRNAPIGTGTERILIVEDDDDLLEVTSETLTSLGYRVSRARDGAEALRILDSGQPFELLLSDIIMPNGVNGVELAREAKRMSKDIKILLSSGYAADVLELHDARDEFPIVEKPFLPSDLGRRLRSILDGSGFIPPSDSR